MMQTYKLWEIFNLKQWSHLAVNDLLDSWFAVFGANWKIGYYDRYMYEEPMVLVSCRWANCGSINLTEPKSWVTWNSIALVPNWKIDIDTDFLYYILKGTKFNDVISGSAQPQIIVWNLTNKVVGIPPLATQRAIADKLDKLQSLIDLKKQAIIKTDELAKSIFLEMFGDPVKNEKEWEVKKFGEIIKIDAKMVDPKKEEYKKLVHIWGANIESETWKLHNLKTAETEGIISWKFLIDKKHILFSKIRPKLKKICYPQVTALCSADIYPMTVNEEKLNQHYLMYYLLWDQFTSIVSEMAEKRAQIPKVNREELEQINFPLPPLPLQQKFADIITQIDAQKSEHKLALAKLEELYQAEMQESFSL